MNVLSLFSGIGGLDLGFKMHFPEARTICFVEIDKYCQKILAKRFPGIPIWKDVYDLQGCWFTEEGIEVDAIIGGFPCQSFSHAGKRKGVDDERGELFWEITRIAGEIGKNQGHLPMLFLENVTGLFSVDDGSTFGDILGTLASMGFDVKWGTVGAYEAGAPHRRDRVWIICDTQHNGQSTPEKSRSIGKGSDSGKARQEQASQFA